MTQKGNGGEVGPVEEDQPWTGHKNPKRHAKSLLGRDDLAAALMSAVRDWVIVTDLSFRITQVNPAALRELGEREEALLRQSLELYFIALDPPGTFESAFEELRGQGTARSFSSLIPGLPYRRRFSASALVDEKGRYGFLFTGGEPVERGDSDEATAVMGLARRILGGLAMPVLLIETGSRAIVDCNERFATLLGRDRWGSIGSSIRIFFGDDEEYREFARHVESALAESGAYIIEYPFLRADTDRVVCRLTLLPFFVPGAQHQYAVGLFEDRSSDRRREEAIASLVADLQGATEALSTYYVQSSRAIEAPHSLEDLGASRRQREIGKLLIAGRSTKEISAELGLTESTVNNHLVALYKKLGVANRVEFIKKVTERGILPL